MFLYIIWILKENTYEDIADEFSEGLRWQIKLDEGQLQRVKKDLKGSLRSKRGTFKDLVSYMKIMCLDEENRGFLELIGWDKALLDSPYPVVAAYERNRRLEAQLHSRGGWVTSNNHRCTGSPHCAVD